VILKADKMFKQCFKLTKSCLPYLFDCKVVSSFTFYIFRLSLPQDIVSVDSTTVFCNFCIFAKIWILELWFSRNARKPIKPYKNSDYSLASKKTWPKNGCWVGARGQLTSAKNAQKHLPFQRHPQKATSPKWKKN